MHDLIRRFSLCALAATLVVEGAWAEQPGGATPELAAPVSWPVGTMLHKAPGQRQVLLFAAPYSFEDRAAIYLAIDLCKRSGAACTVCLVGPTEATDDWYDTPLAWAAHQSGFTLYLDRGGVEANRFSARTSGVCLAYDARGRLCFYGDLRRADKGERQDAGVRAALNGLSRSLAKQDKLVVRPVAGVPLSNN